MVDAPGSTLQPLADEIRCRVDSALVAYTDFGAGCPDVLREAIQYSLLAPGKRLRPMLTLLAAEACGGSREAAIPAACAVEMVHTYSLIHDDLPAMDDDDLRRGLPTCHRKFGEAMAILAGDALLALAFEVLVRGIRPPELAAECCGVLAQAAGASHLVGGQADDILGNLAQGDLVSLESVHRRKTGAMMLASLRLGAIVARADEQSRLALDEYGRRLGLVFQIVDDLLDVCGSEAELGKRVGKDSEQGKLTFPGLLGVDQSHRHAEQLTEEACRALTGLGPRAARLEAVARYVLERKR